MMLYILSGIVVVVILSFFNQKYFIDLMSWAYVKFGRYGMFVSAVMLSATFVALYVTCIILWPVAFLYTVMKA